MKKRKLFLPVFFIILMLTGMISGKAFAADSIINTVSLHCGMRELHLNPALTEYQVAMRLYKRCGIYSDGAYLDTANLFLCYWNEMYNSIYGTGDGSKQVDENRQYYIQYTLGCEVGYDWPEELKKVITEDVPISQFPSFKVYVNGKISKDAYTKCNPVYNLLQIIIPVANDISDGSASLSKNIFTYDGTEKKPEMKSVVLSDGTKLTSNNYTVSYLDAGGTKVTPKAAGKYQAVIEGKGIYKGSIRRSFTIKKAANPITVKGKTITAKAATLAKKNLTWKPSKSMTIKNAQGKLSYKLVSVTNSKYKKFFAVNNKTGVITAKKGLKKGTYKLKIAVTAAGNSNYNAATKNLTTTVKVA